MNHCKSFATPSMFVLWLAEVLGNHSTRLLVGALKDSEGCSQGVPVAMSTADAQLRALPTSGHRVELFEITVPRAEFFRPNYKAVWVAFLSGLGECLKGPGDCQRLGEVRRGGLRDPEFDLRAQLFISCRIRNPQNSRYPREFTSISNIIAEPPHDLPTLSP